MEYLNYVKIKKILSQKTPLTGQDLYELRTLVGLNKAELCALTGRSRKYISRTERNRTVEIPWKKEEIMQLKYVILQEFLKALQLEMGRVIR